MTQIYILMTNHSSQKSYTELIIRIHHIKIVLQWSHANTRFTVYFVAFLFHLDMGNFKSIQHV